MLFSSPEFLFLFLPATLVGYHLLLRTRWRRWLFLYLVLASLAFYSVWNPPYVLLLLASMGGNYLFGTVIERLRGKASAAWALAGGVVLNLAVLGWFKYANFFVDNANALAGTAWTLDRILLPLAISFYTFQQIAYLVDIARGDVRSGGIWRYATFVIFFPQLIAGPIVHYKEMMPQFFGRDLGRFWRADLAVGLAIFAIGLFKKTVIADSAATYASPVFAAVAAGAEPTLAEGWTAAICYTIQLYFDFSGYSDMAIGLARMFGIVLPMNFHAPLRAASIIEYWRRWHMTLQQFIVAYMYQPLVLPLARLVAARGYGRWTSFLVTVALPTVTIFVVIGLWHGAAWTFVLFGLMHGIYLAVNEFWRAWRRKSRRAAGGPDTGSMIGYHALTLFCVVMANVMFRAETPGDAVVIWAAMLNPAGLAALSPVLPQSIDALIAQPVALIVAATLVIAAMPNTQQLMGRYRPVIGWARWRSVARPVVALQWRPTALWACLTGLALFFGVAFTMRARVEFIYFNF